ncbi:phage head morphogenesis protein [Leptospira interrogans]|uniref:phage head morphogenesis protein n=1 Tax=Leptospira interrogans TaxID=173 RepID=UPI001F4C581A|nr:phage minor head protein [Leptospira interrogans]UNE66884.1 phage head morphogenesis protein [Leptospira interrogans]
MYPIQLEQQYANFFLNDYDQFVKSFLSVLKGSIESNFSENLEAFKRNLNESERQKERYEYQFQLVKSWAIDKTNLAIAKKIEKKFGATVATKMLSNLTPTLSQSRQSKQDATDPVFPTIRITEATGEQIKGLVNEYVQTNLGLSRNIKDEYFAKTQNQIFQGIRQGSSFQTIVDDIVKTGGGVTRSKAEFWARDQMGRFFGTVTMLHQTGAGIPGYVWRCTHFRTRDQHLKLDNTYHRWDKRPKILYGTKTCECHPGEDWNCRCWAEPSLGDEEGVKEWKDEWVAQTLDLTLNEANTSIQVENSLSRAQIVESIKSVNSVLNIQPKIERHKFKFLPIENSHPEFGRASGFYEPSTGAIYIKPGIDNAQTQIIHEIFHKLDSEILFRAGYKGHQTADAAELMQAIRNTNSYRNLALAKPLNPSGLRDWSELSRESEWIARIFEQLIANETSNTKLKKQIQARADRFLKVRGYGIYLSQKELEIVLPLMRNFLEKTGLLR